MSLICGQKMVVFGGDVSGLKSSSRPKGNHILQIFEDQLLGDHILAE